MDPKHEPGVPRTGSDGPDEPLTLLLQRMESGERDASEEVFRRVYDELRSRARRLSKDASSTLQATAVVHEAWLKLSGGVGSDWKSREHFVGVAAKAMRSVLVDHARARKAAKRGGGAQRLELDEAVRTFESRSVDLLALDDALRRLAELDPELARVVELRFFAGLTIAETARVMEVSTPTVERSWRTARTWLRADLGGADEP